MARMAKIPTFRRRTLQSNAPKPKDTRPPSSKRGYGQSWRDLRAKQPHTPCVDCGDPWQFSFHLDHDVPRSRGGTDDPANLKWRCRACHSRKTAKQDGGFGRKRKDEVS